MSSATYDILGIGNAIVDVVAVADDAFLSRHDMHKGAMMLVDARVAATPHAGVCGDTQPLGVQYDMQLPTLAHIDAIPLCAQWPARQISSPLQITPSSHVPVMPTVHEMDSH